MTHSKKKPRHGWGESNEIAVTSGFDRQITKEIFTRYKYPYIFL